jgi:hypothetical protein
MGSLFYFNKAKLEQQLIEYLKIPGVFRTKKYAWELNTRA